MRVIYHLPVLLLVAIPGCGSDGGTNPSQHPALVVAGGDLQTGPVGTTLPVEYVVEARDEHDTPLPGVTVYWTAQDGTLSADSGVTDAEGRTSVLHTLGATAGPQPVVAQAPDLHNPDVTRTSVTFETVAVGGSGPFPVAQVPITPNYGIHDTFVRDGIAFVCAWNEGVLIYDVGNGIKGGSPSHPVLVSSIKTANGSTHNAWWFHNPTNGQRKYLFVGEEGPGNIGTSSSGDIHVVDVSNLEHPVEVASYHMSGTPQSAGTHNFWMDEASQVLFAAYYNGGVVALDVSGSLQGSLAGREIDRFVPAPGSYVWGVQLANGSIYLSDMTNGFWQLTFDGSHFALAGGGNNVPERYTSDLWVHDGFAYTGTWGNRGKLGNVLKVWQLDAGGAPTLVDSVITSGITTVSDIEVTSGGTLAMFGAEGGSNNGFHFYDLSDPASPVFITRYLVGSGIHTATFGYIAGRVYAFGAKDPPDPALVVLDVTSLIP